MRAILLTSFGADGRYELSEIDRPEARPGCVLIRVAAAGLNPVDSKIRRYKPFFAPSLPAVPGMDVSGVVVEAGRGVDDFAPGDEVYGCAGGLLDLPGSLAEYMVADSRLIAKKSTALSMREAAAMPLATIAAWEGLFDRGGLLPEHQALIHAGAGGVGHLAVQLAAIRDARVAATVSTEAKAALARSFGAGEVIHYKSEPVGDYVARLTGGRGFDLVFDTVGGANLDLSLTAARLGGLVVSTATRESHDLTILHEKGLTLSVVFMLIPMIYGLGRKRHGEILAEAAWYSDSGRLRPNLDSRSFSLERTAAAYRLLDSGQATGKIVVDIATQ
ncbi:MAG: zinc-dependent alcohol dehydrogenase family protein [Desulfovibrionaceae bacterium]|nr:zinc-dependent alcohol dehydrogenase family protein [Desulfovibrionaceae bacterium]MBF0514438.1 zinc-dependent alcohol dehydrogenase family protein [Desulfovibrionaceae bacterium]